MDMTTHCAPDELLLAYAAGRLDEPLSLIVESHAALNPESCRRLCAYEAIGGVLLEDLPPAPICPQAIDRTLPRLEQTADDPQSGSDPSGASRCGCCPESPRDGLALPAALRRYVGEDLAALPWKRRLPGISEAMLALGSARRVSLVRIAPGHHAPRHTHQGHEVTLVLSGAFRDGAETYRPGDLQVSDESVDHRPRAIGDSPCFCLVVLDAPVRLTGPFGWLLNPFIRD